MELMKRFRLQSAHKLPDDEDPAERRLHGHCFFVEVVVEGPLDERLGWVVDFADLKTAFAPVFAALDHRLLNEIEGLQNPTADEIARWIFEQLAPTLPLLSRVTVQETPERHGSYSKAGR
jgi:6-pyruvoyltetrahydropterin/6-carboxytetrahydropterin synthase